MTKKIKKILNIILICLFIMSYQNVFADNQTMSVNHKGENKKPSFNLLVISSYHQGHYWESFVLEGLEQKLSENKDYNINIKIEYLDFRNRNDAVYQKSFKSLLENKYKKGSIDVICAVNDEAYFFIKDDISNPNSMFYKLPFVFCGVNQELSYSEEDSKNTIGINDPADTFDLIQLIKSLLPDIDNLNIIVENSAYGDEVLLEVKSYFEHYGNRSINITPIRGDYIEDITQQLIDIDYMSNSANIIAGEFQCKNSNIFLKPEETITQIREYNKFPIFSNDQTYLEAGIVGGCVDIGQEHGRQAGELVLSTINGEDLSRIYTKPQPDPKTYIDYNGIYKYNINPLNVGTNAIVFNKQFYQLLLPTRFKQIILIIAIILAIVTITTIVKVLNIRRKYLKEKAKQKLKDDRQKLKSDFIVNLSHELRTPINVILNTTRVINLKIKKNDINKDDIESKLDVINNNSYRLLKISNNIIDLTSSESGLFKLFKKNENIVSAVEEAFIASIEFSKAKNITMTFNTIEEEIITSIDKTQIQRVILNLLSNAIKYTNEGGSIEVDIFRDNNYVEILVKDNGIGIPQSNIDEIFYRFYQVDYSTIRVNEGSGMGLCIVKDIVDYHNGQIIVKSNIGKGSTFKVKIPIKLEYDDIKTQGAVYDIKTITKLEMSDVNK